MEGKNGAHKVEAEALHRAKLIYSLLERGDIAIDSVHDLIQRHTKLYGDFSFRPQYNAFAIFLKYNSRPSQHSQLTW